jgi:hypothetical protein
MKAIAVEGSSDSELKGTTVADSMTYTPSHFRLKQHLVVPASWIHVDLDSLE